VPPFSGHNNKQKKSSMKQVASNIHRTSTEVHGVIMQKIIFSTNIPYVQCL
jgi:hypothetical protein